jgi:hypothetical protein
MKHLDRELAVRKALERWLREDPRARRLTQAVRQAEHALRAVVGDEGWDVYLALEERVNARHDAILAAAIRILSTTRGSSRTKK